MGTVTYPDDDVIRLVTERFIAVQVNIREPRPDLKDLFRAAKPVWAPMFVARNSRGSELARWTGWLPPEEFRARLYLATMLERLVANDPEAAARDLVSAGELTSIDEVKAEVMYWQGAVAYKLDGIEALRSIWTELIGEYPSSRWARSADVLEMESAPNRER